jgi:cytochrome P450
MADVTICYNQVNRSSMEIPVTEKLPQGIELTPLDESFRDDPYPILKSIRESAPVMTDDAFKRYIYTTHDDVKALLRDKELWSDPRKATPGTFMYELLGGQNQDEEPSMLLMDEPDHMRLRSLVSRPFMPAEVERWRPRTREIVARVLDTIKTPEFDLIAAFAGPIPTIVIAEMLGIDEGKHADFKVWSDQSVRAAFNPFPTEQEVIERNQANEKLGAFFAGEITLRRANPGDDLLSDMLRAEEAGQKLSEDEIITQCNLLLIAGNVTTTDLIGNGVRALLDNPEQLQLLRDQPELIENAVEEMLRFDSPVTYSGRIANRSMEIKGCPVKKGESLSTSLAAANRDPDVYPEPDKFDIQRKDTHHQSFGGGRHTCLGANLARLEAQEAVLGLLAKFPVLRHSDKGYQHASIPSFRGMEYFHINTLAR